MTKCGLTFRNGAKQLSTILFLEMKKSTIPRSTVFLGCNDVLPSNLKCLKIKGVTISFFPHFQADTADVGTKCGNMKLLVF